MMAIRFRTKDLVQQIRLAVDDLRMLREIVRSVDAAKDADDGRKPSSVPCRSWTAQHIDRAFARPPGLP